MRRLIIAILLLITLHSEGQIINASQPYRPTWAASCSYLLDQYSGAAAAYSLRKLDCDYTGYAIRVRRSSDNSEQDIGFTSSGDLDTATLKTFVSTNSGYVVTWYDQSGNGYNATQTTANNQPRIIYNGVVDRDGGLPSMRFWSPSSVNLLHTATISGGYQLYAVVSALTQSGGFRGIFSAGPNSTSGIMMLCISSSNNWGTYGSSVQPANSNLQNAGMKLIYMGGTTGSSGSFYINGATDGTYTLSAGQAQKHIGGDALSNHAYNGYISEIILFDNSPSRILIESNINSYYSIY